MQKIPIAETGDASFWDWEHMNIQRTLLTGCVSFFLFAGAALAQTEQVASGPETRTSEQPTHAVPGFDEKLFDPETAKRLSALIEDAKRAIDDCDKDTYQVAESLWDGRIFRIAEDLDNPSVNDVFLPDPTTRDQTTIYRNRDIFPKYPETDCGKESQTKTKIGDDVGPVTEINDQLALSGSIMWAWESLDVPFAYLGYETGGEVEDLDDYYCEIQGDQDACDRLANAGATGRELPIVEGEEDLSLAGVTLGLDIPMGQWGGWSDRPAKVAVSYAEGDSTVTIGTVDAPAESGGRTLLPGPDGGESGASIGNTSIYSSELSDVILNLEAKKWAFGASIPIAEGPSFIFPDVELQYDVYTAYRAIDWVAQFNGTLADYDGAFSYRTEIDQTAWDVFLSVATIAPLGDGVALMIEAKGGPTLYDFEATDMLHFSVFDGDTTGGGTSHEKADSEFKLTGMVKTELVWNLEGGLQLGAEASYGNDFVPSASRDGDNPTTYALEETARISTGVFAKFEF